MSTEKKKIGIFGGSFSPPHRGHLGAARAFLNEIGLDSLYVIPAGIPPHKTLKGDATSDQRVEMCLLTFGDLPATEILTLEIDRGGKSYTADTLRALSSSERELYLLVGTDMFLTLDSWYQPEEIFALATVVLMRREGDADLFEQISEKKKQYEEKYGARLLFLNAPFLEISSEFVRKRIENEEEIAAHVVPRVEEYIKQWQLYKA